MKKTSLFATTALGLFTALLVTGCSPDHYAFKSSRYSLISDDRYEFESTPYLPATVKLKETHSGTVLWHYDIPVNSVLVVDLDAEGDIEMSSVSGRPATSMTWMLYGSKRGEPTDKGEMTLQGMPVMLETSYRPGPELPAAYMPPTENTPVETPVGK